MSSIRVWIGSEGVWSEEFIGIDKVHFIKDAVLRWCRIIMPSDEIEPEEIAAIVALNDLEFDGRSVNISEDSYRPEEVDQMTREILSDERIRLTVLENDNKLKISSTRILKLPLSIFEEMIKWEKVYGHFFSIYKAMYLAAKCPKPAPEGYCLLFKFKDE